MFRTISLVAAAMLMSSSAFGQGFYATHNDSIHQDARPGEYFFNLGVDAINHHDYPHAVAMYKVAASWAYKPAEYNLGVIFAKGEGDVPLDLPQAYAWLTLAAERKDAQYVAARDHVAAALTPEQKQASEQMLVDMNKIYADKVALVRAKTQWRNTLTSGTCSHVGFTGCNWETGDGGHVRNNANMTGKVTDGKRAGSGISSGADIVGGTAVDGSIAYRDLAVTDNPYDPRFNGVVTVGDLKPLDEKKSASDKSKDAAKSDPTKN